MEEKLSRAIDESAEFREKVHRLERINWEQKV